MTTTAYFIYVVFLVSLLHDFESLQKLEFCEIADFGSFLALWPTKDSGSQSPLWPPQFRLGATPIAASSFAGTHEKPSTPVVTSPSVAEAFGAAPDFIAGSVGDGSRCIDHACVATIVPGGRAYPIRSNISSDCPFLDVEAGTTRSSKLGAAPYSRRPNHSKRSTMC